MVYMSAVMLWDTSLLPVRLVVMRDPRILTFSQVQVPGKSFKATMAFFTATDLETSRKSIHEFSVHELDGNL